MQWKYSSLRRLSLLILSAAMGLAAQASYAAPTPQQAQRISDVIGVHKRNVDQLMSNKDVVASGTSLDVNGEPVIRVLTTDLNSPGIPDSVEGVRVLKEKSTRIVALRGLTCDSSGDNICATTERWPLPVPTGVSVGHPSITAGTIGARVTDGSNVFILSNNHVLADVNKATIGDNIIQPGGFDGGVNPDDAIATLTDFEPISFSTSNYIDAAVALSTPAELGNSTPTGEFGSIVGYGTPSSTLHAAYGNPDIIGDENMSLLLGVGVQKVGRTTQHTFGSVSTINAAVSVCYNPPTCSDVALFVDQLIVTPGGFSAGGDSGSLVVTNDAAKQPVGLLFAGSSTNTIINRIDRVLIRFGVHVDGSSGGNVPPTASFTASQVPGTLTVDFDGSGSSDPDGSIVSYAWDFGDGATGSGVTASHSYAAAGTYTVSLTVTDDQSATNTQTQSVIVAPVGGAVCPAAICDNTDAGFATVGAWASSTSTAGYYGADYLHDQNTDKGTKTASWTYAIALDGNYDVAARWTAFSNRPASVQYMYSVDGGTPQNCGAPVDQRVNGGAFNLVCSVNGLTAGSNLTISVRNDAAGYLIADAMQVDWTGAGGNVPPTADFTSSQVPGTLTVDFDGSGSSDSDGTIVSYDWDFGDGGIGSGVTVSHTYAAAGSYVVSLTVTDDQGASTAISKPVLVQPIGGANCPGSICDNTDPGFSTVGAWSSSTSTAGYYGTDYLHDQNAGKGSKTASWRYDVVADGDYEVSARWTAFSNRPANVQYMYSVDGGTAQNCGTPVDQRSNGGQFNLICKVTNLVAGSTFTVVVRNDAAGYLIADAMQFEWVGAGGNVPPVADFTATQVPGTLDVDFDASASTDPDGSIISYDWDFGDGTTGTGVLVTHTYSAAGSFAVSLTVTDDMGATTTTTKTVTVTSGNFCTPGICDNTDIGFTAVGAWASSTGTSGFYGVDYLHDLNVDKGTKTASWSFEITTAGDYQLAAQWASHTNRAAAVQYTYSVNGGSPVNCGAPADQRINGGQFNVLCTATAIPAGSVLTVVITNDASGYVVADAVRANQL